MLTTVEVLWSPVHAGNCSIKLDENQFDFSNPSVAQSIFDDMNRGEPKYRDLSDPKFDRAAFPGNTMRPVHEYLKGKGYACQHQGFIMSNAGITLRVKDLYTNASPMLCLPAPSDV